MPPLECANFLECENKTVCVAPFDLPHGSNTSFFHHIPENYHISPCWACFFFFLFLVIFGQNGLECDSMWNYRRLTRNRYLAHIPEKVIPGDFSQKKRKKKKNEKTKKTKNRKKAKIAEYEDFMEREDLAECVDFTVCVRPYLWSAMPSLECEEFVECEEFRVCVAGIETT